MDLFDNAAGRTYSEAPAAAPAPLRIVFYAPGKPETKGSARPYTFPRGDGTYGARVDNDNPRAKAWQKVVALHARQAMSGHVPLDGPVCVTATFYVERPKGHMGKRGLRASAPARPAVLPDIDKMLRVVLDALSGVVYVDDGRVVDCHASKHYVAAPLGAGVDVMVERVTT